MRHSLAYRKAKDPIWQGEVPEKYRRLLPYISGTNALEIGSAEGVLALTLSREKQVRHITALELRAERHAEAGMLRDRWLSLGLDVSRCTLELGDIRERLELLNGVDTLIAIRAVYYLREDAPAVVRAAFAAGVERVVLCGNKNRQAQARKDPTSELGQFNRLASVEGMTALLAAAGYPVHIVVDEGDPIVVGVR